MIYVFMRSLFCKPRRRRNYIAGLGSCTAISLRLILRLITNIMTILKILTITNPTSSPMADITTNLKIKQ
ncbi:Hypothetical predicted protein [Octopus vulgaris]|uniref:Uncharacterized protein n=1 Tax=Octopus vulgaris TaxID=6645 RepID=A0AA36BL22_OCTVU|nr:Hypothetical predicted protein [Octopus vulgaris]